MFVSLSTPLQVIEAYSFLCWSVVLLLFFRFCCIRRGFCVLYGVAFLVEHNLLFHMNAVCLQRVALRVAVIACTVVHAAKNCIVLGLSKLGVILLEVGVRQERLYKISADGERRTAALSESACAEMDATLLASNPCAHNQLRTDTHEPRIRVVV